MTIEFAFFEFAFLVVSGCFGLCGAIVGAVFFLSTRSKTNKLRLSEIVKNAPYHRLEPNLTMIE